MQFQIRPLRFDIRPTSPLDNTHTPPPPTKLNLAAFSSLSDGAQGASPKWSVKNFLQTPVKPENYYNSQPKFEFSTYSNENVEQTLQKYRETKNFGM